jgi:hypothetical protein
LMIAIFCNNDDSCIDNLFILWFIFLQEAITFRSNTNRNNKNFSKNE